MRLREHPANRVGLAGTAALALGAAALLTLGGCAHKRVSAPMSEGAAEQAAAAAQVAASGGGNPDEPTNAIPAEFAKKLIYPDSTVQHVRKPKGALREILFTTDSSLKDLIKFYQAQLKTDDFEVTSTLKLAARGTWECDFHKGGRQGSVMLYPKSTGSKTMIIDIVFEMPRKVNPEFAEPTETWDVIGPGQVAQNETNRKKRN